MVFIKIKIIMETSLVTGGAGFIGSHICQLLLEKNCKVICLDKSSSQRIEKLQCHKNFEFAELDITNLDEIQDIFNGVDYVFHLGAIANIVQSYTDPEKCYRVNVDGTFNVLEAAKKAKVKKLIYAASASCYGNTNSLPTSESSKTFLENPYALTKYLAEELVLQWNHLFKLPTISLRLFNVYGANANKHSDYGSVLSVFLTQKLKNSPLTIVGDGNQERDFIYVDDVANAFYLASQSSLQGEIFNVGSGKSYSVNYIADLIGGEKIHVPTRPKEMQKSQSDISKIKKMLHWEPNVSLKEGLRICLENIDYYKDFKIWDEKSIEKQTKPWFDYYQ
jgi:UDP-glucose 4-epimerase